MTNKQHNLNLWSSASPTTPVQRVAVLDKYLICFFLRKNTVEREGNFTVLAQALAGTLRLLVSNGSLFCIICSTYVEVCHYSLFKQTILQDQMHSKVFLKVNWLCTFVLMVKKLQSLEIVCVIIFQTIIFQTALSSKMDSMVRNPDVKQVRHVRYPAAKLYFHNRQQKNDLYTSMFEHCC